MGTFQPEQEAEIRECHPEGKLECYCHSGHASAGTVCMYCYIKANPKWPKEISTIFETDQDGEATGTIHTFCSEKCRDMHPLVYEDDFVFGLSHFEHLCDGQVCETCGAVL